VSHAENSGGFKETFMRRIIVLTSLFFLSASTANAAMSEADCNAAFTKSDVNSDGVLADPEGNQYFAAMRIANKPVADGKIAKSDFMSNCSSGTFDPVKRVIDPGAPLKGANSFTEIQAKDWASAAGYSKISALKKDDNGVWRGVATGDGKNVNIAVDFKGNVVAN
jgi:hypothetical protein